jgi:cation diffusion facilitator CzcD-associated flavoprotein CzcO
MTDAKPRTLRFAVIGAGMAGIASAIRLTEAGYDDVVVFEKGDSFGGTWRENTYPGLACDVPSHLYSYSFAPNPDWTHRFSPGTEIRDYFERVAHEHEVERLVRFGEEVTACELRDGRWHLDTSKGAHEEFDVVLAATGVLHHPNIPEFEGIDEFEGASFHSARWDHDVPLDGKRIGVIGTGSTATQITAALVERAAHFSLFQRSAQWIMPQENPPYTDEERSQFVEDPALLRERHDELSEQFGIFANAVVNAESPEMGMIEQLCKANLEESVRDPDLRERLRPTYRPACKRLVVSPFFYEAIQQPNAELVTSPIERIEAKGVRTADGVLHELDVLVLATGFQAHAFMRPMKVVGRGGTTLAEVWADRAVAYLSISIPDFPNLFMLNGPNGPVGNFSLIEVAELQLGYILQLVAHLRDGECREISATQEVLDEFEDARFDAAKHTIWSTGCRSWYLDDRGVPAVWPWPFDRFRAEMAAPKLEAYELR